jgi:hypothetical protein
MYTTSIVLHRFDRRDADRLKRISRHAIGMCTGIFNRARLCTAWLDVKLSPYEAYPRYVFCDCDGVLQLQLLSVSEINKSFFSSFVFGHVPTPSGMIGVAVRIIVLFSPYYCVPLFPLSVSSKISPTPFQCNVRTNRKKRAVLYYIDCERACA